ncbi:MAG: ImmA/IrrE family metallo-endopeptidase [Acetatifactor sp.]|nr:ImmA/IrrE family metallo-endopeptidase [Acetatifactor sp.]
MGYEKNGFRQQFNAAHELGHILTDGIFDIEDMSKLEYRDMENAMNSFAGALLIPKNIYLKDLRSKNKTDFNFYINLKSKYRVSAAALVVRAHQLGAITTNQYQYIMRQRSYGGYIKQEPLDREFPALKPRYLKHALNMIIKENNISSEKFMDSINISIHESMVEKILGVEEGYWGKKELTAPISLQSKI